MAHARGLVVLVVGGSLGLAGVAGAVAPQYAIYDMGVVDPGDFGSQGLSVSHGGVATGRSLGVSNQGFSWTLGGGMTALANFPTRPFAAANGANDSGLVVGTGATTFFGSDPLPLLWTNGVVSQLPLPAGSSIGRANDVNASGLAVGSVGGGSSEFGALYDINGGSGAIITTPAADGSVIRTAFGVNDSGLVVGFGIDPNNAARNVGFLYDSATDTSSEVGALPGANGALAFGVSNGGHVVGSSMQNQGSGTPFIWTMADGISAIPLPVGTSQGSARGVNADGWAVGTASSAFAISFLFDGDETYRLQDLIPGGSGWDLSMNTSSSATGISDTGMIVGTGIFNGETRAYAMVLIPAPASTSALFVCGLLAARRRR